MQLLNEQPLLTIPNHQLQEFLDSLLDLNNNKGFQQLLEHLNFQQQRALDAIVDLDVVDVKTFFIREQTIGEIRERKRITNLISEKVSEVTEELKNRNIEQREHNEQQNAATASTDEPDESIPPIEQPAGLGLGSPAEDEHLLDAIDEDVLQ